MDRPIFWAGDSFKAVHMGLMTAIEELEQRCEGCGLSKVGFVHVIMANSSKTLEEMVSAVQGMNEEEVATANKQPDVYASYDEGDDRAVTKAPDGIENFTGAQDWVEQQAQSIGVCVGLGLTKDSLIYRAATALLGKRSRSEYSTPNKRPRNIAGTSCAPTLVTDEVLLDFLCCRAADADVRFAPYLSSPKSLALMAGTLTSYTRCGCVRQEIESDCAATLCHIKDRNEEAMVPCAMVRIESKEMPAHRNSNTNFFIRTRSGLSAVAKRAVEIAASKIRIIRVHNSQIPTQVLPFIVKAVQNKYKDTMVYFNTLHSGTNSYSICVCGLQADEICSWLLDQSAPFAALVPSDPPLDWAGISTAIEKETRCLLWCKEGELVTGYGEQTQLWSCEGKIIPPATSMALERAYVKKEKIFLSYKNELMVCDMRRCPYMMYPVGDTRHALQVSRFPGLCSRMHRVGDTVRVFSQGRVDTSTIIDIEGITLHLDSEPFSCNLHDAWQAKRCAPIKIPKCREVVEEVQITSWDGDNFCFSISRDVGQVPVTPIRDSSNFSDIFSLGESNQLTTSSSTSAPNAPIQHPQETVIFEAKGNDGRTSELWSPVMKVTFQPNGELFTVIGDVTALDHTTGVRSREFEILIELKRDPNIVQSLSRLRALLDKANIQHNISKIPGELAVPVKELIDRQAENAIQPRSNLTWVCTVGPASKRSAALQRVTEMWSAKPLIFRAAPQAVMILMDSAEEIKNTTGCYEFECTPHGCVRALGSPDSLKKVKSLVERIGKKAQMQMQETRLNMLKEKIVKSTTQFEVDITLPRHVAATLRENKLLSCTGLSRERAPKPIYIPPIAAGHIAANIEEVTFDLEADHNLNVCIYEADTGLEAGCRVSGAIPNVGDTVKLKALVSGKNQRYDEEVGKVTHVEGTLCTVHIGEIVIADAPDLMILSEGEHKRWMGTVTKVYGGGSDKQLQSSVGDWLEATFCGSKDPGRPTISCVDVQLDSGLSCTLERRCLYSLKLESLKQVTDQKSIVSRLFSHFLALRVNGTYDGIFARLMQIKLEGHKLDGHKQDVSLTTAAIHRCQQMLETTQQMTDAFFVEAKTAPLDDEWWALMVELCVTAAANSIACNTKCQRNVESIREQLVKWHDLQTKQEPVVTSNLDAILRIGSRCNVLIDYKPDENMLRVSGREAEVGVAVKHLERFFESCGGEETELLFDIIEVPWLRKVDKNPASLKMALRLMQTELGWTRMQYDDAIDKVTAVYTKGVKEVSHLLNSKSIPCAAQAPQPVCCACLSEADGEGSTTLHKLLCLHTVHASCLLAFHKAKRETSEAEGFFHRAPVTCPAVCKHQLTVNEYATILGGKGCMEHLEAMVDQKLRVAEGLRQCPTCDKWLAGSGGVESLRCDTCNVEVCSRSNSVCRGKNHYFCSCEELHEAGLDGGHTAEKQSSLPKDVVYCRQCPALIMREDTADDERCRYMRCRQCEYEFCWLCLLPANDHKHFDPKDPSAHVECDPENRSSRLVDRCNEPSTYMSISKDWVSCYACNVSLADKEAYACLQCINMYLCSSCKNSGGCLENSGHVMQSMVSHELQCTQKHPMTRSNIGNQPGDTGYAWHVCDSCNSIIISSSLVRCKDCNYDICNKCLPFISMKVKRSGINRTNTVIHGNYIYSTLSDEPVDGVKVVSQVTPLELPENWKVAPDTPAAEALAKKYTWSASQLVLASGRAVPTKRQYKVYAGANALDITRNFYRPSVRNGLILIRQPLSGPCLFPEEFKEPLPILPSQPVLNTHVTDLVKLLFGVAP